MALPSTPRIGGLSNTGFGLRHRLEDHVALGVCAYPACLDQARQAIGLEVDDALHRGPLAPERAQQLHIEMGTVESTGQGTSVQQESEASQPMSDLVEHDHLPSPRIARRTFLSK